jgi:hypothetical protein
LDKRTRILGIGFAVVIGCMAFAKLVYPKWIEPLVHIGEEIAALEERRSDLERFDETFRGALREYREYAARTGAVKPLDVQNAVKSRLDKLLSDKGLHSAVVTSPARPSVDHKTNLASLKFHLEGEGTLQRVIETLREIESLPYVLQVVNPKIARSTGNRREENVDKMLLSTDIVFKVLPQHIMLDPPLIETKLAAMTPDIPLRHLRDNYSTIWDRKPFFEWQAPRPPPPTQVVRDDPPPVDPPPVIEDKRWKDARDYQVAVTSVVYNGSRADQEVLLYNSRRKNTKYVGVGQDFDGGTLIHVHPRGVIVGREDGVFAYPIGESLDHPIKLSDAGDHPELQAAFEQLPKAIRDGDYEALKARADQGHFEHASFGVSPADSESDSDNSAEPERPSRTRGSSTRRTPSIKRRATKLD